MRYSMYKTILFRIYIKKSNKILYAYEKYHKNVAIFCMNFILQINSMFNILWFWHDHDDINTMKPIELGLNFVKKSLASTTIKTLEETNKVSTLN